MTFRCQIGESGPLLKHAQGLCFHHKIRVRAPPFLVLHWPRGRTAHRDCSFSHFWLHFGRQSDAQGRPKAGQGSPKGPKGLPKPPPGRLKIIQKSTWGPTSGPGGSRGAPPGGRMTPKSIPPLPKWSRHCIKRSERSEIQSYNRCIPRPVYDRIEGLLGRSTRHRTNIRRIEGVVGT